MTPETLVFGVLAAVALVHLVTMALVYLFRWRGSASGEGFDEVLLPESRRETRPGSDNGGPAGAERPHRRERPARDAEPASVDCPDCGARNEAGYVYCRECVRKLPAGGHDDEFDGSPYARQPP